MIVKKVSTAYMLKFSCWSQHQ